MSDNDPFNTNEQVNYLEELVGDGKKFKTPEDLAKGKAEADRYIETLKQELEAAKAQAANGANVESILAEIKKLNESKPGNDGGQPPMNERENTTIPNIEELVLQTLTKTEAERQARENKNSVIAKMNEVWGADSGKELSKTAANLGVSVEYLNSVAQQSPKVFFQLTGLNTNRSAPSGTTVPTSKVNFGGPEGTVRDARFYRELKKSNPKLYADTKTQIQMARDAQRIGESFFN